MLIAEKKCLKFSGGSFSLEIYTMESDLYRQLKLAKKLIKQWFSNKTLSLFYKGIPKKIECCVYIIHGEFSRSCPDYTIFICKFETD